MKLHAMSFLRRLVKETSGQAMYIMVAGGTALIGLAGVSVDLGHGYYALHQLQASTNMAALAGAAGLPDTTAAANNVTKYSSHSGDLNSNAMLTSATATPTFLCLTTVTNNLNLPCLPATGATSGNFNALRVVQTAKVPLWFGSMFGVSNFNLTAIATASMRGLSAPYNVAIIVDATLSQNSTDDNCGSGVTEMQCELSGVQALLQELYPCKASYTTCVISNGVATDSVDRVALFTFPALTPATASIDANCTTTPVTSAFVSAHGGVGSGPGWNNQASYGGYFSMYSTSGSFAPWPNWPNTIAYPFPTAGASSYAPNSSTATYEVTLGLGAGDANGFFSDYRTSNGFTTAASSRALNTSSLLVQAAGGGASGCGGIATPNYDGNIGTYYAGVIYAAQSALTAEQAANPAADNVMIILTDGNATAPSASQSPNSSYPAMANGTSGGGTYPSYKNECAQAITAAQYATAHGTTVYSVAYGSETSGCASDNGAYTPCTTMQMMASGATTSAQSPYFYSDYLQSGSGIDTNCTSTFNPNDTSIANIFANIGVTLGRPRLIPNGTT